MMRVFKLTIEMGNDAMRDADDLAAALHQVASGLRGLGTLQLEGDVRDANGNTVGNYQYELNDRASA